MGLKPNSPLETIIHELDADTVQAIPVAKDVANAHVMALRETLSERWTDAVDAVAKKATANKKARNKSCQAVPDIHVGDVVLVADPQPPTKLHFKWTGPWQVVNTRSPFIYEVKSLATRPRTNRIVHICLLRRFSTKIKDVTVKLQQGIDKDYPENVVEKLIAHDVSADTGRLCITVRWLGFTGDFDTVEDIQTLYEDVPHVLRAYLEANKQDLDCEKALQD